MNNNNDESQQADQMMVATKRAFPKPYVLEAIRSGQAQRFLELAQQMLVSSDLVDEHDPFVMDEPLNMARAAKGFFPVAQEEDATYKLHLMSKRGRLHMIEERAIAYGNCWECFKALPLGCYCPDCHERSTRIYVVIDRFVWENNNDNEERFVFPNIGHDRLRTCKRQQADPVRLGFKMMGVIPSLHLTTEFYDSNPDYSNDDSLYRIMELSHMLQQYHEKGRTNCLMPYLEDALMEIFHETDYNVRYVVTRQIQMGQFNQLQTRLIEDLRRARDHLALEDEQRCAADEYIPPPRDSRYEANDDEDDFNEE